MRRLSGWGALPKVLLLALVLSTGPLLLSCGRGGEEEEAGAVALPRQQTLYVAGLQWGAPSTFNPVASDPDWPLNDPQRQLLYETLFAYNMVTGELEPMLATEYRWAEDSALEIDLQPEAHWQNGESFSSADVVYTYDLARRYDLPYSSFWDYVAEVTAADEHTVRMKLNPDNPNRLMVLDQVCSVRMVPRSVFERKEEEFGRDGTKLRAWANEQPVGSGPYRLKEASAQKVAIERCDDYWGRAIWGLPSPKYIVHVIYRGNESGNLALEAGDVDLSQQFVPQIWKMWESGKPVGTWLKEPPYFYVGGSMPSLLINVHRPPLDDVAFRRALTHAINYEKIAELAMTRYSPTMVPGLISKFGREGEYFDQELVDRYGWRFDMEEAGRILHEAGYETDEAGQRLMPDGTPVRPLTMECPHGWTDWMSSLNIAAQTMRQLGLEVRVEFPEYPPFNDRMQRGDFDMVMWNPAGSYSPAQPWLKFRNAMLSRGVPPIGEGIAFWNYGRYRNPEAEKLLQRIPTVTEESERKRLYSELNRIFLQDIPQIPLEYRPWLFYEFNTTWWENFPTAQSPYAPPQICTDGAGIRALSKIRPTGRSGR